MRIRSDILILLDMLTLVEEKTAEQISFILDTRPAIIATATLYALHEARQRTRTSQLVSTLEIIQAKIETDLNIDDDDDDSNERTFFRGLHVDDVKEYHDYWMIFAKGLRADLGLQSRIISGDRDWIRIFLTKMLKQFELASKSHTITSEASLFVSVTTDFDVARKAAHHDPPYSSGMVLTVRTRRAKENLYNQRTPKKPSGQDEWLIPFVIIRYWETIGNPYFVVPPPKL